MEERRAPLPFDVSVSPAGAQAPLDGSAPNDSAPNDCVVTVSGDFDAAGVPKFDRIVESVLSREGSVDVDLNQVDVLDSAALSALLRLNRTLLDQGRRMTTFGERHRRLFSIVGIEEMLMTARPADGGLA